MKKSIIMCLMTLALCGQAAQAASSRVNWAEVYKQDIPQSPTKPTNVYTRGLSPQERSAESPFAQRRQALRDLAEQRKQASIQAAKQRQQELRSDLAEQQRRILMTEEIAKTGRHLPDKYMFQTEQLPGEPIVTKEVPSATQSPWNSFRRLFTESEEEKAAREAFTQKIADDWKRSREGQLWRGLGLEASNKVPTEPVPYTYQPTLYERFKNALPARIAALMPYSQTEYDYMRSAQYEYVAPKPTPSNYSPSRIWESIKGTMPSSAEIESYVPETLSERATSRLQE